MRPSLPPPLLLSLSTLMACSGQPAVSFAIDVSETDRTSEDVLAADGTLLDFPSPRDPRDFDQADYSATWGTINGYGSTTGTDWVQFWLDDGAKPGITGLISSPPHLIEVGIDLLAAAPTGDEASGAWAYDGLRSDDYNATWRPTESDDYRSLDTVVRAGWTGEVDGNTWTYQVSFIGTEEDGVDWSDGFEEAWERDDTEALDALTYTRVDVQIQVKHANRLEYEPPWSSDGSSDTGDDGGSTGGDGGDGGDGAVTWLGIWATAPDPTCLDQSTYFAFYDTGLGTAHTPECTGACSHTTYSFEWSGADPLDLSGTLAMHYTHIEGCGYDQDVDSTYQVPFTLSADGQELTLDGVSLWPASSTP